jgi:hypothetical protein
MLDFTDVTGQTLPDNLKRVSSMQVRRGPPPPPPPLPPLDELQWSLGALAQTPGGSEEGYFFRTYRWLLPAAAATHLHRR